MTEEERRRYNRYCPPEGTIAVLRPYGEEIGRVKNIGKEGLAFEYLVLGDKNGSISTEPKTEIEILYPENGFYLSRIPCEIVWESDLQIEYSLFSVLPTKRIGIQFKELTTEKTHLFNGFLAQCKLIPFPAPCSK